MCLHIYMCSWRKSARDSSLSLSLLLLQILTKGWTSCTSWPMYAVYVRQRRYCMCIRNTYNTMNHAVRIQDLSEYQFWLALKIALGASKMLSARRSLLHDALLSFSLFRGNISVLYAFPCAPFLPKQNSLAIHFNQHKFQCVKHDRIYVFGWLSIHSAWNSDQHRMYGHIIHQQRTSRSFWLDFGRIHSHSFERRKKSSKNRHFHRLCVEMLVVGMR